MSFVLFRRPYRLFLLAAVLALILCLLPIRADEPDMPGENLAGAPKESPEAQDVPAGADLSERTQQQTWLHQTLCYAPCGHSVQRRDSLPAQLTGLTRGALESEIGSVIPGAQVTGFSGEEIDVTLSLDIPCPLHWVLQSGEDGMLHVMQNRTGEALDLVRGTDIALSTVADSERERLMEGVVFDDVQALEGYLESVSS